MENIRVQFEAKGWTWATMLLGGETPALTLIPPATVTDYVICALVNEINSGIFGKLSGGYSTFGAPESFNKERGR